MSDMQETKEHRDFFWHRQTQKEFEDEVVRLKEAVKMEYQKLINEVYPSLTIRQTMAYWQKARGLSGSREVSNVLKEWGYRYDVDSPDDLERWLPVCGDTLDLMYATVRLYPEHVRLGNGKVGWVFRLVGDDPYLMALYAERLQKAGVIFYMDEPERIMKGLGYWIRSKRREYKKVNA